MKMITNEKIEAQPAAVQKRSEGSSKKRGSFISSVILLFVSMALTLGVGEILARSFTGWEIAYYTAPKLAVGGSTRIHPYGSIPVNSDRMFDAEFDLSDSRPVVAYFGDSVAYGVGAGYPYRFTEYLEKLAPSFQHYNLSVGLGVDLDSYKDSEAYPVLRKYHIKRIVYALNLNDIFPISKNLPMNGRRISKKNVPQVNKPVLRRIKDFISPFDRIFRSSSYLYNFIRLSIKNGLTKFGFEASGFYAIEFFPEENKSRIVEAAKFINGWAARMREDGIEVCIAMLPYEMQISSDAHQKYSDLGIKYSKGFLDFQTQKILASHLDPSIQYAILGSSFPNKEIGRYFVYNEGDKIDFNHPNRPGHEIIAREMNQAKLCMK